MSVENPWAQHFQSAWGERAGEPRLPLWLRVSALAYSAHLANGHAVFAKPGSRGKGDPGDVAIALHRVDQATGEMIPLTRANVHRAIRVAINYGWLAAESKISCLVVPAHQIRGGLGSATTPWIRFGAIRITQGYGLCHSVIRMRFYGPAFTGISARSLYDIYQRREQVWYGHKPLAPGRTPRTDPLVVRVVHRWVQAAA